MAEKMNKVVSNVTQTLTDSDQARARRNIGATKVTGYETVDIDRDGSVTGTNGAETFVLGVLPPDPLDGNGGKVLTVHASTEGTSVSWDAQAFPRMRKLDIVYSTAGSGNTYLYLENKAYDVTVTSSGAHIQLLPLNDTETFSIVYLLNDTTAGGSCPSATIEWIDESGRHVEDSIEWNDYQNRYIYAFAVYSRIVDGYGVCRVMDYPARHRAASGSNDPGELGPIGQV